MGKLAQATNKYTVYARFECDGTVEKPDVIGAVFGQTEGLLGADLDLRELQRTGRIGRIDVDLQIRGGKASGVIVIPSSLDATETALIAAAVETIERIGPSNSRLAIERVEDVRSEKRKWVVERAKQLLSSMESGVPEATEVIEQIRDAVRVAEVTNWHGLPAGPDVATADSVIIVEGRADVVNLLRCGMRNCVAIEGTSVPPVMTELSKEKETTVFLDGDRGGDLILKELAAVADIDFVARAPTGKEVEELTKKELFKSLRERVPAVEAKTNAPAREIREAAEARERRVEPEVEIIEAKKNGSSTMDSEHLGQFREIMNELIGTRAAYLLDETGTVIGKLPVREMFGAIRELNATAVLFDGEIDNKLVSLASSRGVKFLVGTRNTARRIPEGVTAITTKDLE
ncbi:MAG: DNA primase DnaG [Candidatus Aenigmatarchaeota archaeon]